MQDARNLLEAETAPPAAVNLEARRWMDLADVALKSGDAPDAQSRLDKARALSTDAELGIRLKVLESSILLNRRRYAEAQAAAVAALASARQAGDAYHEAAALLNLSLVKQRLSRFDEELQRAQESLAAAERVKARRIMAGARNNIGIALQRLGEFERALEEQRLSADLFRAIGDRAGLVNALGEMGNTHILEGRPQKAAEAYEQAYELAREVGRDEPMALWSGNLAAAHLEAGRWDEAARWNQTAADLAARTNNERRQLYVTANAAAIANGRGHPEEAIRLFKDALKRAEANPNLEWEVHSSLGQIYAGKKEFAKANAEFEAGLKVIEQARSELESTFQISLLSRLIKFYQAYVEVLIEQGKEDRALRVIESSRARVLAERLGVASYSASADERGLRKLAASMRVVLLSYWLAPRRSYAWLITPQGVHRFALASSDEIEPLVARYRKEVEGDPLAGSGDAGARLSAMLLGEVAPSIPRNSRVVVVPDGALHRLNLETLKTADGRYWLEDVELAVAPSLSVLAPPERAKGREMLLVGAPVAATAAYPQLANAGAEIEKIRARFPGSKVLTGAAATPGAYIASEPGRFAFIHFAAHAEANREKPLESAVILSPQGERFKLYARDVLGTRVDATLVTISSCKSAGERTYAGEGLIGFAWAFLQAGARSVIAGLWDVSDNRTAPLMNELYAGIGSGLDPVAALHRAKLTMLRGPAPKPYFWAPFQIYVRTL